MADAHLKLDSASLMQKLLEVQMQNFVCAFFLYNNVQHIGETNCQMGFTLG